MFGVHVDLKKNDNLISLFAGFCFFLSSIELMIPKPVPFFRIGLANLPILLGINIFSFPTFLLLLLIKFLGQALISGTLFSYISLFSLLSTFSAGIVMYGLGKLPKKHLSFIGISVLAAFVSNIVQLFLAVFLIFGKSALYVVPLMFIIGLITSIILGVFANRFSEHSTWYEQVVDGSFFYDEENDKKRELTKKDLRENYLRISSGILLFLILFFVNYLPVKALVLGVALILCVVDKQKINYLNLALMFFAIIFFNLFPPLGQVFFSVGSMPVTSEALLRGISKAVILEAMIYISKWMLKARLDFKSEIGASISNASSVFSKLLSVKNEIKLKSLIHNLDAILLSINKL